MDTKFFLITYDKLFKNVFSQLSENERNDLICYTVREDVPKFIYPGIKTIQEWKLPWHTNRYQTLQYYEYGAMVHLMKNEYLIKDLTHIGLLHYDVIFNKNSINNIKNELIINPNQIYYIMYRDKNTLYFTKENLNNLCKYMSDKLEINIDSEHIWNNGWISEALSVTPKDVFLKFANYILNNQYDFEDILRNNRWGIMNNVKHRPCGFVERMWGIYLVSLGLPLKKMDVLHDWESYVHEHLVQAKTLKL